MERAGALDNLEPYLEQLAAFPAERFPLPPLLAAAAQLRQTIAARDALYVALAHSVDGWLLTTDERLRRGLHGVVPTAPP